MTAKEELTQQIVSALARARFPISTPEELLVAFPNGADTTCRSGDIQMTAGAAGKLLTDADFPFTSAGQVANTILSRAGL